MKYHVVIEQERRAPPRDLSREINNDVITPNGRTNAFGCRAYDVTPRPPQLHTLGDRLDHPEDANILYAAEWDGRCPWVTVLKGNIAELRMQFMGWPTTASEKEWVAQCEAQAIKDAESAALRAKAEEEARAKWEAEHPEGIEFYGQKA